MLIRYINGVVYTKYIDLSRIIYASIQAPSIVFKGGGFVRNLDKQKNFFFKFKKKKKKNPQGCKFIIRWGGG